MRLLQDDYLGGQGSRGYGQIAFQDVQATLKLIGEGQYEPQNKLPGNAAQTTYEQFVNNLKTLPEHASRHTQMQTR